MTDDRSSPHEGRAETREEEVARVHSYLASQSVRRTPAQLVETVNEAHHQFLAALASIPYESFHTRPDEGEWSAADVLLHLCAMAAFDAATIPAVIERGEQPPNIEDRLISAPPDATRAQLLADLQAARDRLFAAVLHVADPQAHVEIQWAHPEFGAMHWREWLLFARVHILDHARQLQAIAAAVASQEGLPPEGDAADAGGD